MSKFATPTFYFLLLGLLSACSSLGQKNKEVLQAGIAGKLIGQSDVMGQPDAFLPGVVFVVAPQKMEALLLQIGAEPSRPLHPILSHSFSEEDFQRTATLVDLIEKEGDYHLDVPPGDWWLCLGNVGSLSSTLTFPLYLNGCGMVKVEAGKLLKKDITWGEGGFGLK